MGLRTALRLDAVITAANAVAYLVLAGPLGDLFGLAPALLRGAGAFLLAFAALIGWTASRPEIPRPVVGGIIVANVAWAFDGIVAVLAGWGSPETVGAVWIVAQSLVVAGFAELELTGLRREAVTAPERGVASPA